MKTIYIFYKRRANKKADKRYNVINLYNNLPGTKVNVYTISRSLQRFCAGSGAPASAKYAIDDRFLWECLSIWYKIILFV